MIGFQILALAAVLMIGTGVYFVNAVREYRSIRRMPTRRRGEIVRAFRTVVVAICWMMLPLSFFFRTVVVQLGLGDVAAGQVAFFALAGTNVAGVIYVLVSLRFDD